jgi:hypothetical protein
MTAVVVGEAAATQPLTRPSTADTSWGVMGRLRLKSNLQAAGSKVDTSGEPKSSLQAPWDGSPHGMRAAASRGSIEDETTPKEL